MNLLNSAKSFAKDTIETVGSFIPGVGDAYAQEQANKMNVKLAQDQMAFQERMSNSAYQRGMEDMKKAGLNPMLAFSQGGASSPSGASTTVAPTTRTKLAEFAMSSALGIKGLQQQQQGIDNQIEGTTSQINLNKTASAKQIAETEKAQVETALAKKDLPAAKLKGDLSEQASGVIRKIIDSVNNSAKSGKDAREKTVKVLGLEDPSTKPLINKPKHH